MYWLTLLREDILDGIYLIIGRLTILNAELVILCLSSAQQLTIKYLFSNSLKIYGRQTTSCYDL